MELGVVERGSEIGGGVCVGYLGLRWCWLCLGECWVCKALGVDSKVSTVLHAYPTALYYAWQCLRTMSRKEEVSCYSERYLLGTWCRIQWLGGDVDLLSSCSRD